MSEQEEIDQLRREYQKAMEKLLVAVDNACPGTHKLVQYRDGNSPWCRACGRDAFGIVIRPPGSL